MAKPPVMEHDFASMQPGVQTDWVEFTHQFDPMDPTDIRRYRLDVSWLLSRHHCIYGQGCPSVLITGVTEYGGCCQIGAVMSTRQEKKEVGKFVKKLIPGVDTERDAHELEKWCETDRDDDGHAVSWHTKVIDGNCIFTNRGTNGVPMGCSLHALALRLDRETDYIVSPIDTKPHVCWLLPNAVHCESPEDTDDGIMTITVTSHKASYWTPAPNNHTSNIDGPGWLCTETADAFNGKQPVYREYEAELRRELGDRAYLAMVNVLNDMLESRVRFATNNSQGEQFAGGRPMIPLMVKQRVDAWHHDATLPDKKKNRPRIENALAALAVSSYTLAPSNRTDVTDLPPVD